MESDISVLLREAETHGADTPEFEAWSDAAVSAFAIEPLSELACFEITRFDYPSSPGYEFRLHPRKVIDDELGALANHAWHAAGGKAEPKHGVCALTTASVELVRSQLHLVLWMGARLKTYREFRPGVADRFVERVLTIDWHSAGAVVQQNFQVLSVLGVQESVADNLYNWTAGVDRVSGEFAFLRRAPAADSSRPITQESVLAGAALLWVDAALASSDSHRTIGFMSCAANAMWQVGFMSGWEGKEEMQRTDARHAGKKGGTERHKATRELKQWALAEAVRLRGSDVEIARGLSRRIPLYLQDASADPERLIYDALRTAAATRRPTDTP